MPGVATRAELPKFKGSKLFSEVLATTDETAITYAQRVTKVGPRKPQLTICRLSSVRTFAGELPGMRPPKRRQGWGAGLSLSALGLPALQKLAQLDEDGHTLLHDVCCLWHWLLPKMVGAFPSDVVKRYESLFEKGLLGKEIHMVDFCPRC